MKGFGKPSGGVRKPSGLRRTGVIASCGTKAPVKMGRR